MSERALARLASTSKLSRASTSVETRPGTIFKISMPNATASLSSAMPRVWPASGDSCLASARVFSTSCAYSGIWTALSNRLGFVVVSRGWYLRMLSKSPVSATITLNCLSWLKKSFIAIKTNTSGLLPGKMKMPGRKSSEQNGAPAVKAGKGSMNARIVLGLSLTMNLALFGWLGLHLNRRAHPAPNPLVTVVSRTGSPGRPEPAPAASAPAPPEEFRWSQIESEDYPTYIANLRAIGVPEKTIRDIVLADG